MPPSAAPEWLRTGWILEITRDVGAGVEASIAARIPAQPAPTTRTSCFASTLSNATRNRGGRRFTRRRVTRAPTRRSRAARRRTRSLGVLHLGEARRSGSGPDRRRARGSARARSPIAKSHARTCRVDVRGGLRRIDEHVVVLEQALVLAALLRLPAVAAASRSNTTGRSSTAAAPSFEPDVLHRPLVVERHRRLGQGSRRCRTLVHQVVGQADLGLAVADRPAPSGIGPR